MPIKAGETWEIVHSRKGPLTVRFLQDAVDGDDEWLESEIIEGEAKFASTENRLAQRYGGMGTPGDTLTMRQSFVRLIKRRRDLEN